MTKEEFILLLQSIGIPVNEAITSDTNKNVFPRIVFWDYVWDSINASDDVVSDVVTYQVSFHSRTPRHEKLIELRNAFRENGLKPIIYHEFLEDDKEFHSYFSIDVLEQLDERI